MRALAMAFCFTIVGCGRHPAPKAAPTKPDTAPADKACTYDDAYRVFLKAKAGDRASPGYADALRDLEKAAREVRAPQPALRSRFLISFSQFLNDDMENSWTNALMTLSVAQRSGFKSEAVDQFAALVENQQMAVVTEKKAQLLADDETRWLAEDLMGLQQSGSRARELAQKCWRDFFKARFEKRMVQVREEFTNLSVPEKEIEEFRRRLEVQFEARGFFLPQEVEAAVTELAVKHLAD